MRIPPDFCCATLLVVFASLIGRKRQIRPEKHNFKWVITPNLWGLIVGRSGLLKTPAMKQVLAGLDDLMLISKVQTGKLPDGFTVREVHHGKHWDGLADSAQVQKACDYAEGKKWLIKQPMQTGGRQADRYYLHPQIKDLQA